MSHALNAYKTNPHRKRPLAASQIINRLAAGLLGSYAFAWGFSALGMTGLVASGVAFHEAEQATMLLVFLVFLIAFLWAFAATNLTRVWLVLAGGGAAMAAAARVLQQALLS